eukprot:CAMPEP_0167816886 /NCGR_PEP_ID=MMETSP0112_2-20121227/3873_1 /TAXON_ID=91324 /ORGANISM="Lotharella globosa, Strain CCCM811" /LENGTH=176 /DNA_ID=CAMNT_0007716559 /DNA_START=27 /DNA_END=557 /DNA_ORIENTATION=+
MMRIHKPARATRKRQRYRDGSEAKEASEPSSKHQKTMREMKEAFSLFDTKGTGHVTSQDLGNVMRALGRQPSDDDLDGMIRECSSASGRDITFSDFIGIMAQEHDEEQETKELEGVFKTFDKDGDGYISPSDLSKVMKDIGDDLTEEELLDMISQAHTKLAGKIDFEEFVTLMMSL